MFTTILAFVVVLGILITIHEFGHFAVAKLLKIRVLTFSIGFGPRLVGFARGGTDYRVSAFPLGGYVKMAGDTFDEERKGEPDEFLSHPKWHRFLVALAGPTMNIALAVAIMTVSYVEGVRILRYLKEPAIVGPVADNSIARRAGLRSGDRVISVRGTTVRTWEEMEIALATAPRDALEVDVVRGNETLKIRFDRPEQTNVDPMTLGFRFTIPRTVIADIHPQSPAERAGLKVSDEILRVEGPSATGSRYDEILNIISESKGVSLKFQVRRGGEIHNFSITPIEDGGRAVIGFVPEIPSDLERYGLVAAVGQSIRRNYGMSVLFFKIVGRIFTGSVSVRTLSGPIEIARISGSAARTGSARVFFGFLGLISLQLGLINLLPIPILDGGVIALLLIEGIMGRDLSLGIKEKVVQVGLVFLILLMGFVFFNDLSKIVNLEKLFR